MSDFSAKITALLDTSKIPSQLEEIKRKMSGQSIEILPKLDTKRIESRLKQTNRRVEKSFTESIDPYKEATKSLKELYALKQKYARLGSDKDTDFYYSKAIEAAEKKYRQVKSKTSEPENWDIDKRNELKRQEITLEKEYQRALERTYSTSAKLGNIKNLTSRNSSGNSSLSTQIDKYEQSFKKYGLSIEDSKQKVQELRNVLSQLETSSKNDLPATWKNWENAILKVKTELDQAKLSYDKFAQPASDSKIVITQNRIQKMLQNNTHATDEMRTAWQRYEQELNGSVTEERLREINLELSKNEHQLRESGKWGKSFIDKFSDIGQVVASYVSLQRAIDLVIDKTREAVNELKEIDTLIVEISKANDTLTQKDLERIKDNSFGTASKYGKKATDYLLGVQEMSRAGYKDAEGIAELSVAVQGAGDVTAETANQYVIATDKAYKLNGAVGALTEVFDGSNYITNNNAVNMQELAEGMSIVGSTAASLGVDVSETTAAIGTMAASTQQSGSEVARAFKAILLNIRQVSDEDENIDSEGLTKYEKACNALNVKLKETKNGVLALRDPMEVLKELSTEYNKLDENDIRRTNLLSSVGGKVYLVIQKCITGMNLIAGNPLEPCSTI